MANKRKTRARKGTGSVTRHAASGMWYARFWVNDPATGLRRRKTLYRRTEEDARDAMLDAMGAAQRGELRTGAGRERSAGAWLDEWIADIAGSVRESTRTRYEQCLAHVPDELRRMPLSRLTPTHVNGLIKGLHKAGLKSRSANRVRDVLRNALAEAERRGLVSRNAAALARPIPQRDVGDMAFLEPEQVPAFLELAAQHREGALWVLCLGTGLRLGEAQGLRWTDLDLDRHTVHVRRALRREQRDWVVAQPKTRAGLRDVEIPAVVVEHLRGWQQQQHAEQAAAGSSWTADPVWAGLVFTTLTGEPPTPSVVSHHFRAATRAAGFELRFHDLRHSTASLLLAAHTDMRTIAAVLGHANPGVTAQFYAKVGKRLRAAAGASMNRILTNGR